MTDGPCVNQVVELTAFGNPVYYSRYEFECCDQSRAGSRAHAPKSNEPIPALYNPYYGEDIVCETWSTLYVNGANNPPTVPGGNLIATFNGFWYVCVCVCFGAPCCASLATAKSCRLLPILLPFLLA